MNKVVQVFVFQMIGNLACSRRVKPEWDTPSLVADEGTHYMADTQEEVIDLENKLEASAAEARLNTSKVSSIDSRPEPGRERLVVSAVFASQRAIN